MFWLLFSTLFALALLVSRVLYRPTVNYKDKHVIIVGGSEGIGKDVALKMLNQGAKVTIMARTVSKLEAAVKDLVSLSENSKKCRYISIDVTNQQKVNDAFRNVHEDYGPIECLILAAGKAYPDYILSQDITTFEKTVDLNYLGAVRCVKAVLPFLIENIAAGKCSGSQICFIGSACSVIGFLGYGSYSPTKFALKGFSDTLRNEISGTGVSISFAFPPDCDTPGFEEENKTKPKENLLMFPPEVYSPSVVADYIVDGLSRKEYTLLSPDVGQNLLVANMSGLTPRNRWAPLFILLSPLIHIILILLSMRCDWIANSYAKKLLVTKKTQ